MSTPRTFPMPFGGIDRMSWRMHAHQLTSAVAYLTSGCGQGHGHNFAVDTDGGCVYTTQLGIECLERHRSADKHTTPMFTYRADDVKRHGLWPAEMDALAKYNSERACGLAHLPEWDGAMAALQDRFDAHPET